MNLRSTRHKSSCEFVGTFRFIEKLLSEGLSVAKPLVDDGVDLLVYSDREPLTQDFAAVPIQLKCFSSEGFIVDHKYDKIKRLFIAYLWFCNDPAKMKIYLLPYSKANMYAVTRHDRPFKRTKGVYCCNKSVSEHIKTKLQPHDTSSNFTQVLFRNETNAEPGTGPNSD